MAGNPTPRAVIIMTVNRFAALRTVMVRIAKHIVIRKIARAAIGLFAKQEPLETVQRFDPFIFRHQPNTRDGIRLFCLRQTPKNSHLIYLPIGVIIFTQWTNFNYEQTTV